MVHPGIDLKPGTKKALYCVRGNSLYTRAAEELDVRFRRPGTLILLEDSWMRLLYPLMKRRARLNGIEGIRYLSNEELKKAEPYLSGGFFGAVLLPTAGIISPYRLTVAYAENAVQNGAEISLNTIALSMELEKDSIVSVRTNRGTVYPSIVINAAGAYADSIADMAGDQFFTIHPRKGEVAFLDEKKGRYLNSVLGRMDIHTSSSNTKGGGLVKTIDGNVLVGPDAYEQPFREDYSTNSDNITKVLKKHLPLMPIFSPSDVIAYCAGIRAATYEEDFIVEKSEYVKNLVHAAGIQSPGLASAPAIAEEIESIAVKLLSRIKEIKPREGWNPRRKGIPDLKNMGLQEKNALISKRPDYGTIVCRCEGVSRGEIVDAINSPIPVRTVDGIKRRVKPGMGRCQGGFCMPLVMSILAEEGKTNMLSITKKGGKSSILAEETKTHIGGGGDEHGNV
jgi:glycerol-3-phosphate dehydrogenase